jgi:hypothetical protein
MNAPFSDPAKWQILWPIPSGQSLTITDGQTGRIGYYASQISDDPEYHLGEAIDMAIDWIKGHGAPSPQLAVVMCEVQDTNIDTLARAQLPGLIDRLNNAVFPMRAVDPDSDPSQHQRLCQGLLDNDIQVQGRAASIHVYDAIALICTLGGIG